MKIDRIIDLLKIEQKCILRNTNNECNRQCGECDLVQDDAELNEMYTNVINILAVQNQDAIPVEWLEKKLHEGFHCACTKAVLDMWQEEQKVR